MANTVYGFKVEFQDELDLLEKIISLYSTTKNMIDKENYLRPKLVKVLSFYVLRGYSKETKELILSSLNINTQNLNTINSELTKKGYLVIDPYTQRKKHLSKELQELKDYFLHNDSNKVFMVKFGVNE